MVGIELVADKATKEEFPEHLQMGAEVTLRARAKGVIIRPLGDVIVLMPPLAMTEAQLEQLVSVAAQSIDEAVPRG